MALGSRVGHWVRSTSRWATTYFFCLHSFGKIKFPGLITIGLMCHELLHDVVFHIMTSVHFF